MRRIFGYVRPPKWWDDENTWLSVGDIAAMAGTWLMIVLFLALIVSAL